MATGFEAGSDDDVDPRLVEKDGFVRRRRGADGEDSLSMTFVKDLPRRNAQDEAEDGDLCIEHGAHLIFKPQRTVRLVSRELAAQSVDMLREGRETSRKCFLASGARTVIFHRDPQIDGEGTRSERADLSDHLADS